MKTLIFIILITISFGIIAQEPIRTVPSYIYRTDDLNTLCKTTKEQELGLFISGKEIKRHQESLIDSLILSNKTNPVYRPALDFATSIGWSKINEEDMQTIFVIEDKEVLRFYEDSIIIYFKGREIVITDDSLCNTLNRITEETFK